MYGTRRLLVDQFGKPKFFLKSGELKSIQSDRVILVLGPPKEICVVRWIFSAFIKQKKTEREIADALNRRGISSGLPRPWTYARVKQILRHEIYLSNSIWNRTSFKLKKRKVRNPREAWLETKCTFPPIIERAQFEAAQAIFHQRQCPPSKEELLETMRQLYRKHGYLDLRLIEASRNLPSLMYLRHRFRNLGEIHKLIGSRGRPGTVYSFSNDDLLVLLRKLLKKRGRLTKEIINKSRALPHASTYTTRFGSLERAYQLIGYEPDPQTHQGSWSRTRGLSDDQLLEGLRRLLCVHGHLNETIIDESHSTPTSPTYWKRFGSLCRAYELIGYRPNRKMPTRPAEFSGPNSGTADN